MSLILLTCANQVKYVCILLTKSLKLQFFLWLVFTLFCDTNVIGRQAGGTGVQGNWQWTLQGYAHHTGDSRSRPAL